MTRALLLLIPLAMTGQDLVSHGADIFNKSCATGYCHGLKGAAGGAPRLAARGFDEQYIAQVVRAGVPGTAMPAFAATLSRLDMAAVVAYVGTLNGITPSRAFTAERGAPARRLPPEAAAGRALFFEAARGFGRCSTCHQVDGIGIPVSDPIAKLPENAAALRALATPKIVTAQADGDSFPALVLSKGGVQTKVFDLTTSPPSLRTLPSAAVKIQEGSSWRHANAIQSYSDADLDSVLVYLRATVHP